MILSYEFIIRTLERLFVIIGLALIVLVITNGYFISKVDTFTAETEIFYHTIINAKQGISYHNLEIDRLYPGLIDLRNWDHVFLDGFYPDNKLITAKIKINNTDTSLVKEYIYNQKMYERWEPLVGFAGPGGTRSVTKVTSIQYIDSDPESSKPGLMSIEMVMQNFS